jgi:hypothetical protein
MFDLVTNGEVACRFASYETAASAESLVRHLNKVTPGFTRIMKRKVAPSIDWKQRELSRFASGEYQQVPWENDPLFTNDDAYTSARWAAEKYAHHYVHISKGQPN